MFSKFLSALIAAAVLWGMALTCNARGDDLDDAYALAEKNGKPVVIWVSSEGFRKVPGAVSVWVASYGDKKTLVDDLLPGPFGHGQHYEMRPDTTPRILVARWGASYLDRLDHHASNADLQAAIAPKAVSRQASPFEQPSAGPDGDPWLSSSETDKIKALWPKGVPWNKNVKWYRLAPLYQSLTTMNNGRTKVNVPTSIHDRDTMNGDGAELSVSGGMAGHAFKSIKGIDFAGKKVIVWQEDTDVAAFALVPRWRWQFQKGTIAYDLLLNDGGLPFELRSQTKIEGGTWETDVLFKEVSARPVGYDGLKQSCASCHNRTAAVLNVPGKIYRRVRWGDDSRFSWRPFDESAQLDRRWPLEEQ